MTQAVETQDNTEAHPVKSSTRDWLSLLQFILSILAVAGLWGFALISLGLGGLAVLSPSASPNDSLSLFMTSAVTVAFGFLVVPSTIHSFRRIIGKPVSKYPQKPAWLHLGWLILLFPIIVLLGQLVLSQTSLAWLLLPPLHVLAVLIPIGWLIYMATRRLPNGSPQRGWGLFDSGLVLAPILVMIAEIFTIVILVIIGFIYISSNSQLYNEFISLAENITSTQTSPEYLLELLAPFLASPLVIASIFLFTSLLVPLIEEALKPIGVWLLLGRGLSRVEGFTAGILSGAGFALFETLTLTSSGIDWAIPVVARIGTAIIHMLTAGLMGWAIAAAWRTKSYGRLFLTYLAVVLIHGVWNAVSLFLAADGLYQVLGQEIQNPVLSQIGTLSPYILGLLAVAAFAAMLEINLRFRRQAKEASQPETSG